MPYNAILFDQKTAYFRRSIHRLIDHKSTSVPTIKSRLPMIILPRLSSL